MATFTLSRSLLLLLLMALLSRISNATPLSLSFTSSHKNASFASKDIALYGNAKLVDGGSSIQMNDSVSHGGGRVVYKKPMESVDTESAYFAGFSTVFSFSTSPGRGGRIGFVMFPANGTSDHSFQVKLDISENFTKFRDSNVTVIVDGPMVSKTISNLTIVYSEKEKKEKLLYAWIYYQARAHYLTVSVCLSKAERFKSANSLYIPWINLLKDEDQFMVGLKSYSGNFNLHSWKLRSGYFPKYMHSYTALLVSKRRWEEKEARRRRKRMWKIVTCFGFTGIVFFAIMCIWAAFKRNKLAMVIPEECGQKMEKMELVMSKAEAKQERE